MLVHYMHHIDRSMGYPGIWLSVILGISVKVFLGEMNILIGKLNKVDCFFYCERDSIETEDLIEHKD